MGVRVTASMLVRNEADRYLSEVLSALEKWVDEIVIVDDCSSDNTIAVCHRCKLVSKVERLPSPVMIEDESRARRMLWELTVATGPDWILAIDADELFEPRVRRELEDLIDGDEYSAVEFRLFDLWNSRARYRVDGGWNPWSRYVRRLVRHRPGPASWPALPLHCGSVPLEYRQVRAYQSDIRIMHLGWVNSGDHASKHEFYRCRDTELTGRQSHHTESIVQSATLEDWYPIKELPF